jgi:hypothetical protein
MAATQAVAVNSPISSVQGLQLPQAVFNALVRGITAELTPDGVGLQLGVSLQPFLLGNPLSVALSTAIKTALTVVQAIANPVFDASEQLLTPVAQAPRGRRKLPPPVLWRLRFGTTMPSRRPRWNRPMMLPTLRFRRHPIW